MESFQVSKFQVYRGPNYYLDRQALVFNLRVGAETPGPDRYLGSIIEELPALRYGAYERTVDLFVAALMEVLRMDINLYLQKFSIDEDEDEFVIAVEYLDDLVAELAVELVSEWFAAMTVAEVFDFKARFTALQQKFDATYFGGPTFYSLYEAALKRNIPVHYLKEEGQFQWGYGKKQVRGRSTTVSIDGIKDTEFTMYKDMVGEFLDMCGFPTPKGFTCYSEEEIVDGVGQLAFPVVVKPVAGHKGQGVTTGIRTIDEARKAFRGIVDTAEGEQFDGVIVQQQIEGTDHRLLAVGGKFVAALERVPAYVDGDGANTIEALIEEENGTVARLDNARSPLCKIKIDDDLREYLELQGLSLGSVVEEGKRVFLRRVANISAGGVSVNVTDKIHPDNVKLVEDIASFFHLTCLGIDVLTEDISRPWTDGNFGIIEINAGPGVFMHLAPAIGGSIDVPGKIMKTFFPATGSERVPIIAGNCLTQDLGSRIFRALRAIRQDVYVGALTDQGVFFNDRYFFRNPHHDQNVKIVLRQPLLEFALFHHDKDTIWDYGLVHQGADVVVLETPGEAEECLRRDLLPGGYLLEINDQEVKVVRGGEVSRVVQIANGEKDSAVVEALAPLLPALLARYEQA